MHIVAASVLVLLAAAAIPSASQPGDHLDLLERAADYVVEYEKTLSSLVAEEDYLQLMDVASPLGGAAARSLTRRRLRSDFLLAKAPGRAGWVPFRDVFEVDGKPVRDRDERLMRLFVDSPAAAWDQANRILMESARYNIGVSRTINVPTLALLFLRDEYRGHFEFSDGGDSSVDGVAVRTLRYREIITPTVIHGLANIDLPASGMFWIEPASGRVLRSQVKVSSKGFAADIVVTYRRDERMELWVPVEMRERYRESSSQTEGLAKYSRFRKFGVTTTETLGKPPGG
jgi:hypothetical protein